MSNIPATIAILALGVFLIAVPAALYFIFREMRAIRKVLQARWDYDSINYSISLLQDEATYRHLPVPLASELLHVRYQLARECVKILRPLDGMFLGSFPPPPSEKE